MAGRWPYRESAGAMKNLGHGRQQQDEACGKESWEVCVAIRFGWGLKWRTTNQPMIPLHAYIHNWEGCVRANDGLFLFLFVSGVVFCIVMARHGIRVRLRVVVVEYIAHIIPLPHLILILVL